MCAPVPLGDDGWLPVGVPFDNGRFDLRAVRLVLPAFTALRPDYQVVDDMRDLLDVRDHSVSLTYGSLAACSRPKLELPREDEDASLEQDRWLLSVVEKASC